MTDNGGARNRECECQCYGERMAGALRKEACPQGENRLSKAQWEYISACVINVSRVRTKIGANK